jgi:hypothetical protein
MFKRSLFFLSILTVLVSADTIYEDGGAIDNSRWLIYDNNPSGAKVVSKYNSDKDSNIISIEGNGTENGYWLRDANGNEWNNTIEKTLEWSMDFDDDYMIYIRLMTKKGFRFLVYTPKDSDGGLHEKYIYFGLGSSSKNGTWQTFTKDLEAELQKYESDNSIVSINGFMVRGDGYVDDIALLGEDSSNNSDTSSNLNQDDDDNNSSDTSSSDSSQEDNATQNQDDDDNDVDDNTNNNSDDSSSNGESNNSDNVLDTINPMVYEDAEDGRINGWSIYDKEPMGAKIFNVYDSDKKSRVIGFNGDGLNNGYILQSSVGNYPWNNRTDKVIRWSMKFSEDYDIYIRLNTDKGLKYIHYTPVDTDNGGKEAYIEYGLGTNSKDGKWRTYTIDVEEALHKYQPDTNLISIDGFMVRGNGYIDNILTMHYIASNEFGKDTTPPKITLNGDSHIFLNKGESYNELGAVASDNVDSGSDLASNLTIDSSNVNINKEGIYTVKYSLHDNSGNTARSIYRFVTIRNSKDNKIIGNRKVFPISKSVGTIFISPTGTGNQCTQTKPCAFSRLSDNSANRIIIKEGDIVIFRAGVYKLSVDGVSSISFVGGRKGVPTIYQAYPNERVIFDGSDISTSGNLNDWKKGNLYLSEDYTWFRNIEVRNMPTYGIRIFGNNNVIEGCSIYNNHLSGVEVSSSQDVYIDNTRGSYNIIRDNQVFYNSDVGLDHHNYSNGNNADGITVHTGVQNRVSHNVVYANSDDGIDSWLSVETIIYYNKVYDNGRVKGDGNGIKLGGASDDSPLGAKAYAHHNLSFLNTNMGFNINSGKDVVIENNSAYRNAKYGFSSISSTTLRGNFSYKNFLGNVGWDNDANIEEDNSWQKDCNLENLELNPTKNNFLKLETNSNCQSIGAYSN